MPIVLHLRDFFCALTRIAPTLASVRLRPSETRGGRVPCPTAQQVKGRAEQAKGKTKEVAGKAVGNKEWEQEGKIENTGGKVQKGYGDVKEDIKKSI